MLVLLQQSFDVSSTLRWSARLEAEGKVGSGGGGGSGTWWVNLYRVESCLSGMELITYIGHMTHANKHYRFHSPVSAGPLEYTDCVSAEGVKKERNNIFLDMTVNCIWWWVSSSGALEFTFIAITPRSTLIWSGSTC